MKHKIFINTSQSLAVTVLFAIAGCAHNQEPSHSRQLDQGAAGVASICQGYGPQTPRDIASLQGTNPVTFPVAPATSEMNLCNIHFHNGAEHKAPEFSTVAPADGLGHGGGYQCGISTSLSESERRVFSGNACKGVEPGDTIEVHWVHSTCDVSPGPGLVSCLSEACANPSLRVETQVFTVVNDDDALDFNDFNFVKSPVEGLNQAKSLPAGTGTPVQFLGSSTGPKYSESICSPWQVTWSIRPQCAKVSIQSLSRWCENNVFEEDHAHGVRKLITNSKLLSPIK